MSEDDEEIVPPTQEEIETYVMNWDVDQPFCDTIYHWLKYLDNIQRRRMYDYLKGSTGIGIGDWKEAYKNCENSAQYEEDPFWLKIYKVVNKKYGKRIKAMEDSRQLMLKRGNIYTPNIIKFTQYLSGVMDEYKTGYRNTRNDVLEKFKDSHLFSRDEFCREPFILNFPNGYYDIINNKFVKAKDSKKIFFYEIPHEYKEDKDYKCPKFLSALQKWLGVGNKVSPKDMFQLIGYTMTMNVGQRKAFLIHGPTKSGKTQFYEILKYLIGGENTTDISLQMLGSDKFSSSSLEWKILNYHDEVPKEGLNDVSLFKIIAGGGSTFPVRRMHTEWYQAFNTVKLWYNTNIVPMTKATEDDSFFNRWIIVNFPNEFIEDSKDPVYEDIPEFYRTIIEDEDEVQGIIHYCIKALELLYKNKHFRKELSANSRKLWEYESDLQYAFIDKYSKDGRYWICKSFYKWCNIYRKTRHPSSKRPALSHTAINKDMETRGYDRKRFGPSHSEYPGKYYFNGIQKNKRFKKDKKNNFKRKSYKTTSDYLEDHPDANMNGNGKPEQYEDMGEVRWEGMNWDNKEEFEGKLITKKK
ncbi:hypothetical protein LCGC14_1177060 [marine sediment metagenome]|uniref:SF3 helicase domain-containing protein n=1 Tax=marine sediment metagenome TaxID=412755 RepID=A0A0F9MB04_9ZZZZ